MALRKRIPAWVLMAIGLIVALAGSYWSSFAASQPLADEGSLQLITMASVPVGLAFIAWGVERMGSQ